MVVIGYLLTASAPVGFFIHSLMLVSAFVYLFYFTLAYLALTKDRIDIRLFYLLSLPAYWLLIAPATLIALYRMARGEMGWMKTAHRPFRRRTKSRT